MEHTINPVPAPLEFDKLNEQGMAKGIPSSMIYQVYVKDGLQGLDTFVKGWKKDGKRQCANYLDQHHNESGEG